LGRGRIFKQDYMAKTSKKSIYRKRKRIFFWLLVLLLLLLFSIGKRGFIQHIKVKIEHRKLKKEIEALKSETENLKKEKELLKKPEYIEKVAREEYGMAKKGEKVYKIVPEKKDKTP